MRYLILSILFASIALSQYVPIYNAGISLPTSKGDMQFFYRTTDSTTWQDLGNFGWVCIEKTPRVFVATATFGGGSTDSTVYAKLWKLGLYAPLATVTPKMDSVRVNSLLSLYALSTSVTPKMDSTRVNSLLALYLKTTAVKSGAYWDTTTITYGTVTIPAGDSIQVSITGTTASSVVTTAYRGGRMVCDTVASWQIPANGKITIYGKYNKVIGYSVRR
jgi:hypothetical protein